MPYRAINAEAVIETIDRLQRRIDERFSGRGIAAVCREVGLVARKDRDRVTKLQEPYRWVRFGVFSVLGVGLIALFFLIKEVKLPSLLRMLGPGDEEGAMLSLFQGIDSAVNIVVLLCVGLFFLLRHEEREKQRIALEDLYELRSLAHVIDMHQLTKDPTTLLAPGPHNRTPSSPHEPMSTYELVRYLDYCSELLSLVAKIAAVYAQDVRDPVVIEAVSDIEDMTTSLSRKIWQKIAVVEQMDHMRAT